MRWFTWLSVVGVLTIGATLIGASQILSGERRSFLAAEVERESSYLAGLANLASESRAAQALAGAALLNLAQAERSQAELEDLTREASLLFVAQMAATQDKWSVTQLYEAPALALGWPEGAARALMADLPLAKAEGRELVWYRGNGPKNSPVFLLMVRFHGPQPRVAIGAFSAQVFAGLINSQLSHRGDLALVDEYGYALLYSQPSYVGTSLEGAAFIQESLKIRPVLGHFESTSPLGGAGMTGVARVPRTNLLAVVHRPFLGVTSVTNRLLMWGILLSLVIVAMLSAFLFLEFQPIQGAIDYMSLVIRSVAAGQPVGYPSEANEHIASLTDDIEKLISADTISPPTYIQRATEQQVDLGKMGAYKEISLGLSQALSEPLAMILGQAQLARAKSGGELVKEPITVIEREARKARELLENVLRMSGEERFPRSAVEIQDVVLASLSSLKNLLAGTGIKVTKELTASALVQGHAGQLQTAFEELLRNSIDALSGQKDPEIRLTSRSTSDGVEVIIEDNGPGFSLDSMTKVFDPFFTTHTTGDHKGLGLTVAKGIIKGLGGRIFIENASDRGARVVLRFPSIAAKTPVVARTSSADAGGSLKFPLTGTEADQLPTAPSKEEITLIGVEIPLSPSELPEGPIGLSQRDAKT